MGGTRGVGVDMAPQGLRGKRFLLFDEKTTSGLHVIKVVSWGGGWGSKTRAPRGF